MEFSIIIPTHNSEKYIKTCLDSVLNINYPKKQYEIIIADGKSKDNTLKIAKKYSTKIINVPNKSISNNKNTASKSAKGKYLVFIDSDCVVGKDYLKIAEKLLKKYDCVGGFYKPVKNVSWVAKGWLLLEKTRISSADWIVGGNMIIKKDVFTKINGFDNKLITAEDTDICYRLKNNGYSIFNEPRLEIFHLGQTSTLISFFKKEMWRGNSLIKMLRKYRKEEILSFIINSYHLFMLLFLVISLFFVNSLVIYSSLFLLVFPSFALTLLKSIKNKKLFWFPAFFILLLVYYIARGLSLVRYNQFKDLF